MKYLFFLFYLIATPILAQYGLTKSGLSRNTAETTFITKNGQLLGTPTLYKSGKLLNIQTPDGKLNYKHYNNTSTSVYPNNDAEYNSFLSGKTVDKSGTLSIPNTTYSGSLPSANLLSWSNYSDLNAVIGVNQADGFAMEVSGYFIPQETGAYTFTIQGDDAVDLFIGGNFVASVYGGHGANALGTSGTANGTGQITLIKGVSYSFKVRQQEGGGGEAFYLYWRRPSQSSGTNWYQYSNELSSVQMSRMYSIPTTNLVSYLDASNYTSYGGSGTTWTDLSSNTLNGTIYNGSYSPSNDGTIVLSGSTNSYIEIPATNLLTNQTAASFSIWFNTTRNPNTGTPNCILGKSTSTGSYYGLTLIVGSNGYVSTVKSTGSNSNIDNSYATNINTWYNITITIDQTSVKNYINGVLVTTSTNNSNWSMSGDVTRIGASIDTFWTGFSGKIGAVMIYNKVLSASETTQIFESQKQRFGL